MRTMPRAATAAGRAATIRATALTLRQSDSMNFALILFVLTAVTGVIWLLDRLRASRKRRAPGAPSRGGSSTRRAFFPVLLVVFLLRSFLAEPFKIPSSSMRPTLEVGDFILVNKFVYGIRLPIIEQKIIPLGDPKRGDVVVFRYPLNPSQDFIKRVVGVAGDVVEYRDKTADGERQAAGRSSPTATYSYLEGLRFETLERSVERDRRRRARAHTIGVNHAGPAGVSVERAAVSRARKLRLQ